MDMRLIVGSIFFPVGLGLLGGGAWVARHAVDLRARAVRADGEVVGMLASRDDDGTMWAPRVRFRLPNGQSVDFVSSVRTKPPAYAAGDKVVVLYEPERPSEARIDDWMSWWFAPTLLGGLGTVFTILGGAFLWSGWRARQGALTRGAWASASGESDSLLADPAARRVTARVIAIDREADEDGGSHWVVVAQAHDPTRHRVLVFRSQLFDFDPGMWIAVGRPVTVAYDPDDPESYEIDLAFLPARE